MTNMYVFWKLVTDPPVPKATNRYSDNDIRNI